MRKTVRILCLLMLLVAAASTCFAGSTTLSVSATILSKNNCKFNSNALSLDFGTLDPVAAPDVTRQATLQFACNGKDNPATFFITDDDGLYETGPDGNRMQHDTLPAAFLPYALTASPLTGSVPKGVNQTLTITGTLLGNDYRTAYAGRYTDRVVLSINP